VVSLGYPNCLIGKVHLALLPTSVTLGCSSASEKDVSASGRNIFDVDDLTKRARTSLVLFH